MRRLYPTWTLVWLVMSVYVVLGTVFHYCAVDVFQELHADGSVDLRVHHRDSTVRRRRP